MNDKKYTLDELKEIFTNHYCELPIWNISDIWEDLFEGFVKSVKDLGIKVIE